MNSYPNGAGDVVQQIFELRRLLNGNPKVDALIAIGFLIGREERVEYETVERTLIIERRTEDGATLLTLDVEEKGVITNKFASYHDNQTYTVDKMSKGVWEKDLDFWYRKARTERQKLLTSGPVPCPLDTDGDGNCPRHPEGCPA